MNVLIYEICQGIDVMDEEEFLKFINKNIELTPKTLFDILDEFVIKNIGKMKNLKKQRRK